MKKRNGWLYAFWILLIVLVVVVVAAGAITWAGSSDNEESSGTSATVTGVTLDSDQLNLETEGENATGTLTATVATDTGETFGGAFSWTSSNEDVATVEGEDETAMVTAVAEGVAIITVTLDGGYAVCLVVVSEPEVEPEAALIAELSATDKFSMNIGISVTVNTAELYLYSDGTATLDVNYTMMVVMTDDMALDCAYTISDDEITLSISLAGIVIGEGEGTVVYGTDGSISGIMFTSFMDEEQDIKFVADGYEGSLYVSRRLEIPDPENDELDASAMALGTGSFEGYDYTIKKSTTTNEEAVEETVYLITGTASAMTEAIATWYNGGNAEGGAKAGDSYIVLKIYVGIGNKISYTSYGQSEKTYTNTDGTGSFDGDYFFVCERLTGVYADGSQVQTLDGVTYTITDASGATIEEVNIEFDMRTAPWDGTSISTAWDVSTGVSQIEEYTLYSAEELAGLAYLVNDDYVDADGNHEHHSSSDTWINLTRNWTVKLGADIDLGDEEWEPIGGKFLYVDGSSNNENSQFRGSFDGQNHTVYNLKVSREDHQVVDGYDGTGLFGFVGGGEIKNLTVENVNVSGRRLVGGIIGVTYEFNSSDTDGYVNVDNCHVTGHIEITGHHQVGGIVGSSTKAEFSDCSVEGDATSFIQSTYAVDQYDKNCTEADNYDADADDYDGDAVGGIVGYLHRSEGSVPSNADPDTAMASFDYLTDCTVSGVNISGCRKVGGLVGHNCGSVEISGCTVKDSTISLVYNKAYDDNIDGSSAKLFVGALVGEFEWLQKVTGDCTVSNVTIVYISEDGITGNYTPAENEDNPYAGLFGGSRNQAGYKDECKAKPYSKVIYAKLEDEPETYATVNATNLVLAKLKYEKIET